MNESPVSYSPFFWLVLNGISICLLGIYSMLEMACVSFNKVRLQYYVSKGYTRSIWLNYLLQNPSRLFGTTLIGVNIALVIGSECSREFYSSLGLSPDIAPLTQVILVVIFGELAPMFAARRYPEHVASLGVPLIYFSAKLMTPLLFIIDLISKSVNYFFKGKKNEHNIYITEEELVKIIEEQSDNTSFESENDEFRAITANIFALREKSITQVMEPIKNIALLPQNAPLKDMEALLKKTENKFVALYQKSFSHIVGIIYPREALRCQRDQKIKDYASAPWFVTEGVTLIDVLKQFRINNENLAVILNNSGNAIGIVTLDDLLEEIFGKISYENTAISQKPLQNLMLREKTFSGSMTVNEFNCQYGVQLDLNPHLTLSELLIKHLGHYPEKGESLFLAPFELTVKENTLNHIKSISISTKSS